MMADSLKEKIEQALEQQRHMDVALLKYDAHFQNQVGIVMQLGFDIPDLTPQFNTISGLKLVLAETQLVIVTQLHRWRDLL